MIKYIILDLDGTLYKKKSVVKKYLLDFCLDQNLNYIETHKIFSESYLEAKKLIYSNTKEFWQKVHDIFLERIQNNQRELLEDFCKKAYEELLIPKIPRKGLITFLKKSKKANFKIIVFSGSNNMYDSIDLTKDKNEYLELLEFKKKQIKSLKLDCYIDKLILSHKYGGFKPQKFVFERLLDELNAKAYECLMIGDSYNDMGGVALGIFSILIGKNDCDEYKPNFIANSFFEIIDIIDFERCVIKPNYIVK
jgi:putative hydrolase of the HAD superfamily